MTDMVGTAAIFIAYRESDAKAYAIAVRDVLEAAFGEDALFLDKDTLTAGAWAPQLSAGIARCRVFVLVIGRHWLDARAARPGSSRDVPAGRLRSLSARGPKLMRLRDSSGK